MSIGTVNARVTERPISVRQGEKHHMAVMLLSSPAYHNVNVFLLFHNTLEELCFEMVTDPEVYFTPWVIFLCNNNNSNSQHTCSAVNKNQAHNKMQSGCSQRLLAESSWIMEHVLCPAVLCIPSDGL